MVIAVFFIADERRRAAALARVHEPGVEDYILHEECTPRLHLLLFFRR